MSHAFSFGIQAATIISDILAYVLSTMMMEHTCILLTIWNVVKIQETIVLVGGGNIQRIQIFKMSVVNKSYRGRQ